MATHVQAREHSHSIHTDKGIDTFVTRMQSKGLELKLVHDKVSSEFLICNSCFWCVSTLGECDIPACPSCKNNALESFPISKTQHEIDNNNGGDDNGNKPWPVSPGTPENASALTVV